MGVLLERKQLTPATPKAAPASPGPGPLAKVRARRTGQPLPETLGDLEHWHQVIAQAREGMRGLDHEDRAPLKAKAIKTLEPFINDYLHSGRNHACAPAVWVAVWLWDLGHIEQAVDLTLYLIAQGQKTPREFDSDLPTFICDQIYDYANAKFQREENAEPYLSRVIRAMEAGKWVVHEIPKGKVYAMAAKLADRAGDSPKVVMYAQKALEINERAGVKKILKAHEAN